MNAKLTIQEVARVLVEKNNLTPRDANRFAVEMFAVILDRLEQGELVKIIGLGTFKIIGVEARESVSVRTGERVMIDGHSKVSFTPDTTMKELVNRPFSQFETVVLNDGVDFDDVADEEPELVVDEPAGAEEDLIVVADDVAEDEPVAAKQEEEPVAVEQEEEPIAVEEEEEPIAVEQEKEPIAVEQEEEPIAIEQEEEPVAVEQEETPVPADDEAEEPDGHSWLRWLLGILGVAGLMALSAYGGYRYGVGRQPSAVADTIIALDTVYLPEPVDSMEDSVAEAPAIPAPVEQPAEVKPDEKKPAEKPAEVKPQEPVDRYAAKDERVRLGAYRIVGTEREVTVQPGQNFYRICLAHLGPDMECYVEVYNDLPRNPTVKVGQVIKIPKLQFKKKRR